MNPPAHHPKPATTPETRLGGIRTWIEGQLRQQAARHMHDPRNAIIISADQARELVQFLDALGILNTHPRHSTLPVLNSFPLVNGSN